MTRLAVMLTAGSTNTANSQVTPQLQPRRAAAAPSTTTGTQGSTGPKAAPAKSAAYKTHVPQGTAAGDGSAQALDPVERLRVESLSGVMQLWQSHSGNRGKELLEGLVEVSLSVLESEGNVELFKWQDCMGMVCLQCSLNGMWCL